LLNIKKLQMINVSITSLTFHRKLSRHKKFSMLLIFVKGTLNKITPEM